MYVKGVYKYTYTLYTKTRIYIHTHVNLLHLHVSLSPCMSKVYTNICIHTHVCAYKKPNTHTHTHMHIPKMYTLAYRYIDFYICIGTQIYRYQRGIVGGSCTVCMRGGTGGDMTPGIGDMCADGGDVADIAGEADGVRPDLFACRIALGKFFHV